MKTEQTKTKASPPSAPEPELKGKHGHSSKQPLSRKARIWIGVGIVMVGAGILFLLFLLLEKSMYVENPRMTLLHLEVRGSGWWNNRTEEARLLLTPPGTKGDPAVSVVKGESNIFALKPARIRQIFELLPEVESARVERIIPDKLRIQLTERIPRAVINNRRQDFADEDLVILPRSRSIPVEKSLPKIYNFKTRIPAYGEKFPEIAPAMKMIRLASLYYPEIQIYSIDLSRKDVMIVRIFFRHRIQDTYRVIISRENIAFEMDVLISALRTIKRTGETRRVIDLTVKGQAVLKHKLN